MSIGIERTGYTQAAMSAVRTAARQSTEETPAVVQAQTDRVEISAQGRKAVQSEQDYTAYLQNKFSYMNAGTTTMSGIPTTVTVSNAFLQKCVDDPEKAAWLEKNLAVIPESTQWANNYLKSIPGGPVRVYQSITIDENGNMSMCSRSTNDPDGKIAKENAEEDEEESRREKVAVNEGKRARQIAAARTPSQVQQVLALLDTDLQDCKAGLERGACDEAEVQKVEALIRQAQSKMAQVAGNDEEEGPGLSAFDLAGLM